MVIADLEKYLALLPNMSASDAFAAYWAAQDVPLEIGEHYRDTLNGVPILMYIFMKCKIWQVMI